MKTRNGAPALLAALLAAAVETATAQATLRGRVIDSELGQAVADEASPERLDALIATDDEYLVFCGVVGLGRLLAERQAGTVVQRLRSHAGDPRWRVREAVAMEIGRAHV